MATLLKPPTETTILVVDDTPDNLRLLSKMLESQGYGVRKSLNGKMALQGVQRDPPDLILLDITMPDMNGYEVCQHLKSAESTAEIPIIFISALDQINDKVRAFEMGGQDYITKPFQELEVLMRVKNQLLIQQQRQKLIEQNHRLEQEVQERLKAEAEVRQLSLRDELTGLYNRRGFFLLAEQQLKIARRTQTPCSLWFGDLDGLKLVNDTLGHDWGDRLLVDAAQVLQQVFRDSDILARYGGDEFVAFILGCTNNLDELQKRFHATVDRFNQNQQYPYQLSVSMGMNPCALNNNFSLEQLVVQADKLMYEHKRTKLRINQCLIENRDEYQ
ncbi:MAG: diguanylate cyclase [Leptolyngbyaceae cyanobacterium bins.59]|nr:diguanylate cyclase [Leptolyngbyaceae cyanobacterium bins.59]